MSANETKNPSSSTMAAAAVAATTVLGAAGYYCWWNIFRRRTKPVTSQDLQQLLIDDDENNKKKIRVPSNLKLEIASEPLSGNERDLLMKSFVNSPDFFWIATGEVLQSAMDANNNDDDDDDDQQKKSRQVEAFMVGTMIRFCELYGETLVCRNAITNEFYGAVCMIQPYTSSLLYTTHFYRTVIPMGRPITQILGPDVEERFQSFVGGDANSSNKVMQGKPHWHIHLVGVTTEAQGKGVGRLLMESTNAIINYYNWNNNNNKNNNNKPPPPACLGCHNGNVKFYEKMGYHHADQYHCESKLGKGTTFPNNLMTLNLLQA